MAKDIVFPLCIFCCYLERNTNKEHKENLKDDVFPSKGLLGLTNKAIIRAETHLLKKTWTKT